MAKKKKNLVDGIVDGHYVRCWKEGRDFTVQVWNTEEPDGMPDGDWFMPGSLGLDLAVKQAIVQTPKD